MDPRVEEFSLAEMWAGFQMNHKPGSYEMSVDQMAIGHGLIQHRHDSIQRRGEREHCTNEGASTCTTIDGNNSGSNVMNQDVNKEVGRLSGNGVSKAGDEGSLGENAGKTSKTAESPEQDYIHVRARRGQATDSHSLAERARREKISERMKILQDLVPGCNKVIGKALVLDEIINYIQSLQHQVEFLSMKLEAVNSRLGMDQCHSKEFPLRTFNAPTVPFDSQNAPVYSGGSTSSPEWLQMHIGGSF